MKVLGKRAEANPSITLMESFLTCDDFLQQGQPLATFVQVPLLFLPNATTSTTTQSISIKLQELLGENFNKEQCMQYFLPQLIPFYMRFFHVYDSSLQGETVEDYLANAQLAQPQIIRKENKVKVRVPIADVPMKSILSLSISLYLSLSLSLSISISYVQKIIRIWNTKLLGREVH